MLCQLFWDTCIIFQAWGVYRSRSGDSMDFSGLITAILAMSYYGVYVSYGYFYTTPYTS